MHLVPNTGNFYCQFLCFHSYHEGIGALCVGSGGYERPGGVQRQRHLWATVKRDDLVHQQTQHIMEGTRELKTSYSQFLRKKLKLTLGAR